MEISINNNDFKDIYRCLNEIYSEVSPESFELLGIMKKRILLISCAQEHSPFVLNFSQNFLMESRKIDRLIQFILMARCTSSLVEESNNIKELKLNLEYVSGQVDHIFKILNREAVSDFDSYKAEHFTPLY